APGTFAEGCRVGSCDEVPPPEPGALPGSLGPSEPAAGTGGCGTWAAPLAGGAGGFIGCGTEAAPRVVCGGGGTDAEPRDCGAEDCCGGGGGTDAEPREPCGPPVGGGGTDAEP